MGKKRRRICITCKHAWIKPPITTPHGCELPKRKAFEGKSLDLLCDLFEHQKYRRNEKEVEGISRADLTKLFKKEGIKCSRTSIAYAMREKGLSTINSIRTYLTSGKGGLKKYEVSMLDGTTENLTIPEIHSRHDDSDNVTESSIRNRLYNKSNVWRPKRKAAEIIVKTPRPEKKIVLKPIPFTRGLTCYRKRNGEISERCKHFYELSETFGQKSNRPDRCKNATNVCSNYIGEQLDVETNSSGRPARLYNRNGTFTTAR